MISYGDLVVSLWWFNISYDDLVYASWWLVFDLCWFSMCFMMNDIFFTMVDTCYMMFNI